MKSKAGLMAAALCGAILLTMTVQAAYDRDMRINGHFRGTSQGYKPVPGWTLTADGGSARILPTLKPDKFMLEILAASDRPQSVVSDLYQVFGNTIEIKADLSGRGYASIGFEAFDSTGRQLVAAEKQTCTLSSGIEQKFKRYFFVNAPAQLIRIRLTAEPGSTAVFRDVEAEMKMSAAPAPQGAIAAPAPLPAAVAAPQPAPVVSAPATAPAPLSSTPTGPMLQHNRYYRWNSLGPVEHFQVQLPVGSDIDFDLQENPDRNLYWSVISYDARICRIKVDHDRDGFFPFRVDKAEFELKALWRGTTTIVLACGGKKIYIHFTAL